MRRARLVIADRHPIVLQGLISVIATEPDFEIVASCLGGTSCIEAIRSLAPDIALLGDSFPDVDPSEILAIANAENLPTRFVFFTSSIEQGDLAAAIADGACSEISKHASPESLLQSLRLVTDGTGLLREPSPDLAPSGKEATGLNMENVLSSLTDREREIIRLVAEGLSNKAVARQLNISEGTIKVHLHHIYQKLEINNRTVLAAVALSQRGFGLLSLTALTFATMGEVKAADPNETFLDDDNIAYKDLEHGVFELWTKEAIPRHIIVEDPAETVVLTRIGSSVSVSQVANSAARMEELQAAQQAVLANFAKGYGPGGSGTPSYLNQQLLQPINFTQPGDPTTHGSLPPLEFAATPIYEPVVLLPPPPVPPSLNAGTGPTEIDTVVFDTFTATTGIFTASSPREGATLIFSISGGTASNTTLNGATYDVSKTGLYGTLYLNSTTGAFIFVPNNDAINALKTDTTQSFIITVSDGTLSASETFTISIHGVDDAAIISGTATGAVIEAGDVAAATLGLQTATGTLTDVDVDDPANTFRAINSPTKSAGGYGTFTMTAAGVWTYTLDETNSTVQALGVGETLTDTFTVTTIDGTAQVVTITIHGPLIAVTGTAPSLTLSETHLTATALDGNIAGSAPDAALTTTSGNFATAFTSVQGVDGATISYALSITGGNGTASGLIDSHTGQADVLVLNGNTIEGHVGSTSGALAFTITIDPATGRVTFTEYRAVTQPSGEEGASLTAGIVILAATITDKQGDFQTVIFDLGSRLTLTDDSPTIAPTGTAPSLTLSEVHLTATALDDNVAGSAPDAALTTISGNFSTAFTSVQGADGATISYALSITGGNGTASGLIDSHTGRADVLVLNGNTIEGHVGTASGALAFTITLDPATGRVTFTEYRAVTQPSGAEGASLTTGIVTLTATIADSDGDFQTASIDLGSRLTITDDGPVVGGFSHGTIVAEDGQVINGTFNVSFGADGDAAMRVAVHDGTVNGYNLATTDLGGGITSVHVTGNGDDYTFYYTTRAVNGGVELNAFFTDTDGTLSDAFFTLLINPDGTYSFDIEGVGFLQQTTVTGSDFGASSSGQPSLTAPDGLLVITGEFNGAPADVKASNNGIAVGDTGLQMDQHETLLLTFTPEQTDVSFSLTQWQGNGTADVVFTVYDGATEIHSFNINIPKPSADAHIVVVKTSDLALVNTYTFDSATSTYTLYVGSEFNQIDVSYDHAATGNTTFTVNNITYSEGSRIPSTDLLFDVTAVDGDGDSSTTSLEVDLVGSTSVASGLTLSATTQLAAPSISDTGDAAIISGATTGSLIEASGRTPGAPATTGTLDDDIDDDPDIAFMPVGSPPKGDRSYGTYTMTAAGVWSYTLDDVSVHLAAANSSLIQSDNVADFAPGSDKINLADFGALAFLHLDSINTAVPPHTLAWIYDSARNETVVYVNPTDQALDVGASALLEIHLHGVASVQRSDFIFEATTAVAAAEGIDPALAAIAAAEIVVLASDSADVSSDATDGVNAHATSSWTLQPADQGLKFDFHHGGDSIGSVRLARFSEASADASAARDGDAVVMLASASPNELWHDHITAPEEEHFEFHQGPIHASASAVAAGETAALPPSSTIEPVTVASAAAASEPAAHESAAPGHQPAPASSGHAEIAEEPGHGQSFHFASEVAASHHTEPVEPEAAGPAPAHGHGGPAAAEEPGHQQSFHFTSDVAASHHIEPVEPDEIVPAPAPVIHGHAPEPVEPVVETASLSPAEEPAAAQAHITQVHAATHGHHLSM